MRATRLTLPSLALLAVTASPLSADTLSLYTAIAPDGRQIEMPKRGYSMAMVESRFGQPQQKLAAVGDPPIIRWIYPGYTVYFEGEYVIQPVPRRELGYR